MILLGIGILCVLAFAVVIGVLFGQRTQDADASPPRNTDTAPRPEWVQWLKKNQTTEIRIEASDNKGEPLPGPVSKFGGEPSVPAGFGWPRTPGADGKAGSPLSFMAQLNFRDFAPLDKTGLLPQSGVLSFFYDLASEGWGDSPDDRNGFRLVYFPDDSALAPMPLPADLEPEVVVPEMTLRLSKCPSYPYLELFFRDFPDAENADADAYEDALEALGVDSEDEDIHKVLGWPNVIQNPMEEDCERIRRGLTDDLDQLPESVREDILESSGDWLCLLQLGTIRSKKNEIMFGDVGHLYVWIRKQDLAARNFSAAWVILQCF